MSNGNLKMPSQCKSGHGPPPCLEILQRPSGDQPKPFVLSSSDSWGDFLVNSPLEGILSNIKVIILAFEGWQFGPRYAINSRL